MKVLKNLTGLMIVGAVALVIGACGKQTATNSILGNSIYSSGSCSATATGENVYDGTITNGDDLSGSYAYNYNAITSGSVKLSVIPMSSAVSAQYTASAVLTLGGSQYCCTSQGTSIFGLPASAEEKATVSGLTLVCYSSTTSTGYFGTASQAITLKIGVPVSVATWESGEAVLTTEQKLMGYIQVSGGAYISGTSNAAIYFVM